MTIANVKTGASYVLTLAFLGSALGFVGYAVLLPVSKAQEPKADALPIIKIVRQVGDGKITIRQSDKETINGKAVKAEDVKAANGKDGVLELRGKDAWVIEVKELPGIIQNGDGHIIVTDVKAKVVKIIHEGKGDVRFAGSADELNIIYSGSGSLDCRMLKVKTASIVHQGSGDVLVNSEELKVVLSKTGNVRYLGSPKVEDVVEGTGTVAPFKDK